MGVPNLAFIHWFGQLNPYQYLPPEERKQFTELAQEKSLSKGEILFHEGQKCDSVWLLKDGRVHLNRFLQEGQVSTTCIVTPGETFCCLPALDHGVYPINAIAAIDSAVIRIPSDTFSRWLRDYAKFANSAICTFCNRLREVECHGSMIYASVEHRVAQVLLTLAPKFGSTIPLTRQEIAELAGTTLETTIRTLSRMKQQKIIRSSRGKIILLDKTLLESALKK